jgi:threonine/homoserine/homoserine lactone efflux protein
MILHCCFLFVHFFGWFLFLDLSITFVVLVVHQWGTVGYEDAEQNRPQFEGQPIRSPITGKPTLYFSAWTRMRRSLLSQSVVSVMILVVIGVIAIIFTIRIAISQSGFTVAGQDISGIIASLLIALQIQFLNGFFGEVALKLNNHENHRTDTEYEDALIAKTFAFQFINSFASLFYISFVKPFIPTIDPCANNGSCMSELQTALGTIFLTRMALGNFTEVGLPLWAAWRERKTREAEARRGQQERFARSGRLSAENLQSLGAASVDGMSFSSSQVSLLLSLSL